ncbi:MAG TPA: hypothetical protein VN958_01120, partial [Chitinophagaceae bacterium]|nr:hypothetical protein [Chitinophagaceae bacterium]
MKTLKQSTLLITGLLLVVVLMLTALTGIAQNTTDRKSSVKDNIPFGKKLPPPDLTEYPDRSLLLTPQVSINTPFRQGMSVPDAN